jgi:ribonuclease HII
MPWVVGIDEAGYGPNLGPLVQAAVGLHLSDDDLSGWETLRSEVRRSREKDDGRLLVDDSKKVYTRGGLAALEQGVWSALDLAHETLEQLLFKHAPSSLAEIQAEHWYEASSTLPLNSWERARLRHSPVSATASVVATPRFNRICDESGSKGTVVARGLVDLMATTTAAMNGNAEPAVFLCDKLGGKNYYAGLVQQAFPEGWVVAEKETAAESRYRVERLDREITVVFRPRSDGESVAVALASMLAKYLREVCMFQFNRYWARHVPGIEPTAGYPVDARRFYAEIRDTMVKLGLSADQVWRKR